MRDKILGLAILLGAIEMVGCVPIRQQVPAGRGIVESRPNSNVQYESPDDYKNLGPDAWKDEMEGIGSWYGWDFNGKLTSSGEIYDMNAMTAAHKTLPLGTVVKVNNLDNGKSVQVKINDRGPYVTGRIIDLSKAAAEAVGISTTGTAHVKLEIIQWPTNSK
jgi:rare lipoprotein A (peptidoglycan hydrolase)